MAAVQERNGSFRVIFRHRGRQHAFTLGRVARAEAEAVAGQADLLLLRLGQGLIQLPPGVGIVDFIRHGGNAPVTKSAAEPGEFPTLGSLRDRYLAVHEPSLEETTLDGIRLHFKHLAAHLGEPFPVADLALADLQGYVDARSKAKGHRGRPLSPATIRKELVTLRTAWNWGTRMGIVAGRFPAAGLRYPKTDEKPPFMTREEIVRLLPGTPGQERAALWDALYLTGEEIAALLATV